MKALLRTWMREEIQQDDVVEIDPSHDFLGSPYEDTVPFSVGSNQEIIKLELPFVVDKAGWAAIENKTDN